MVKKTFLQRLFGSVAAFCLRLEAYFTRLSLHFAVPLPEYPSHIITMKQVAEIAALRGETKLAEIADYFCGSSDLLAIFPMMHIQGSAYAYVAEGAVRIEDGVLKAYPQVERLRIAGGDLDVDKALVKIHGYGIKPAQERMQVKALSLYLTGKLINGDSELDGREFDGLKKRIRGEQLIPAGRTPGGDAIDTVVLDEAIDAVDTPTHILMSKRMAMRFFNNTRTDNFYTRKTGVGDTVLPVIIVDYDDVGHKIIDFTEECPSGGDAEGASIYVVNLSDTGLCGLQNDIIDVYDLGEVQDRPVFRTRVEWLFSIALLSQRSAVRIWGIKDTAVIFSPPSELQQAA